MKDPAEETTPRPGVRDAPAAPLTYEPPTITELGDAVRVTLGSSANDTADMARYYY